MHTKGAGTYIANAQFGHASSFVIHSSNIGIRQGLLKVGIIRLGAFMHETVSVSVTIHQVIFLHSTLKSVKKKLAFTSMFKTFIHRFLNS